MAKFLDEGMQYIKKESPKAAHELISFVAKCNNLRKVKEVYHEWNIDGKYSQAQFLFVLDTLLGCAHTALGTEKGDFPFGAALPYYSRGYDHLLQPELAGPAPVEEPEDEEERKVELEDEEERKEEGEEEPAAAAVANVDQPATVVNADQPGTVVPRQQAGGVVSDIIAANPGWLENMSLDELDEAVQYAKDIARQNEITEKEHSKSMEKTIEKLTAQMEQDRAATKASQYDALLLLVYKGKKRSETPAAVPPAAAPTQVPPVAALGEDERPPIFASKRRRRNSQGDSQGAPEATVPTRRIVKARRPN